MHNKIKQVVLLSDLHIGSTVAIWPSGFVSQEGIPIGQNAYQQWLGECWNDLHKVRLPAYLGKDPYAIVLNGDLVDGNHFKSLQHMTSNVTDQMTAAKKLLAPVVKKASTLFVTKGTEIHTIDKEVTLGEIFGAVKDKATGQHAFDKLNIRINGVNCIFKHHMTTALRPYWEAAQLSTELASERMEAARSGHPIPEVLCCAHRHRHAIFRDLHGLMCVTGGWQGLTRHVYRVVSSAAPAPSCIVLDWRGKSQGELPHTEEFIYVAKPPKYLQL